MSERTVPARIGEGSELELEEMGEVSSQEAAGPRDQTEIAQAISSLTAADWLRLRKVSHLYARRDMSAKDVLQEAIARALEGSRVWPKGVDFVRFLVGVMSSIANVEYEKAKLRPTLVMIDGEKGGGETVDYPDPTAGPEDQAIQRQQVVRIRSAVLSCLRMTRLPGTS